MKDKKEDTFFCMKLLFAVVSLSGRNGFCANVTSDTCPFYLQNNKNNNNKNKKTFSCAKWMKRCLVFSGHQVS